MRGYCVKVVVFLHVGTYDYRVMLSYGMLVF
jgi:hypothetical protein